MKDNLVIGRYVSLEHYNLIYIFVSGSRKHNRNTDYSNIDVYFFHCVIPVSDELLGGC